jgi:3-oxoacyl-[acyl-carrier-protein] synthase II
MPSSRDTSGAIAITGVGVRSPLGDSFAAVADALLAGRPAIRAVDFGTGMEGVRTLAAPLADGDCVAAVPAAGAVGRLERINLQALAAALADGGVDPRATGPRLGLVLGQGAEQLKEWEADFRGGGRDVFTGAGAEPLVERLAAATGCAGPAATVGAACASSGFAIALARSWLDAGLVDICVAGGCEVLSPIAMAAFHNLRALSRWSGAPDQASRPFDRQRDGFVMGEGGAFLVLEPVARARARGAVIRGLLTGVGTSSDAAHMVAPCSDPTQAARAIGAALADAGIAPVEVDYVNAHAAGTPVGDVAEAAAIRRALGDAAATVPVSSTKGLSGHLVSGAAAFEALACLVAFDRRAIPATANLDTPDERCVLDHVRGQPRECAVRIAASNSFGFGGANLCLILERAA